MTSEGDGVQAGTDWMVSLWQTWPLEELRDDGCFGVGTIDRGAEVSAALLAAFQLRDAVIDRLDLFVAGHSDFRGREERWMLCEISITIGKQGIKQT